MLNDNLIFSSQKTECALLMTRMLWTSPICPPWKETGGYSKDRTVAKGDPKTGAWGQMRKYQTSNKKGPPRDRSISDADQSQSQSDLVNFFGYLNQFETFFTVTPASTGVSSRLTMIIGSTTRPSAPERTPSVRKTRLATTSTTTPCPRSTFQVWSLTFCLLWSSNQRALNLASCIAYETSELKQQSGRRWCPRTLFGATNNYRKPW